jgi:hypothetical protein
MTSLQLESSSKLRVLSRIACNKEPAVIKCIALLSRVSAGERRLRAAVQNVVEGIGWAVLDSEPKAAAFY